MSRARQLTTKNLLETLKYYFDGMLPTQFAEKLLTNLQQGSLDVEKLNFAIFILEAFTPIEAKLELEGQVHRSVYLHWEATLKRRIRYIQNTNTPVLQYQHTLMSRTNQLSVDLACLCEPVLGKNRFQILCPTLESPVSKITLTNLNELALTDFVLSDRGSGFIEIEACLLSASSGDGVLRHTQLLEPEMVGEREVLRPRTLSDAEVQRVVLHNSHARALYEAIQTLQQLKNNQATVGGCLRTLIDGLSDGSSHRVSKFKSTKNGYAGDQALSAISSFTEVYEHLLPAIRAELNNMRCDHHDFLYYLNELGASYEHRREEVRVKAEAAVAALQELTNQDELLQQVTSYLAKQEKEAIERISISNDMLRGDKTLHVTKRASERLTELSKVTKSDDIKSKFIVLIRSWSESDREKILQEIGECVYLTGQGLEGLWKNNKARLYEMVIDGAPQGLARQVAEIEVRIKEYSEELSDYLRKLSHGEPYRPLWVPDNFNENEALLQAWFEQVEMTHFKQIMPVLLKYFRFAPRQLLKLKIAEFMSDNQLT